MGIFLIKLIFLGGMWFIVDLFTYKFIRKLDKKERKNLQDWETDYLLKQKEEQK